MIIIGSIISLFFNFSQTLDQFSGAIDTIGKPVFGTGREDCPIFGNVKSTIIVE